MQKLVVLVLLPFAMEKHAFHIAVGVSNLSLALCLSRADRQLSVEGTNPMAKEFTPSSCSTIEARAGKTNADGNTADVEALVHTPRAAHAVLVV